MSSGRLAEVESKRKSRKSGRGRLREVVARMALTEDIFGVLGRWLPATGDRTWKFDCIITLNLCLLRRNIADILHLGLATTQAIRYFQSNRSPGRSLYSCIQNIETVW